MEDVIEQVKLKIKQLKNKFIDLPKAKAFYFTEYVERQKGDVEIDLGLFLNLAEENKILYNEVPVTTLIEDMENLTYGFFMNGCFSLGDEGEIDTKRFFKDINELAVFIDKILDKFDDYPSIYYTGNIYRCFRNFKRVNRSEHGKGAKEFNDILEHKSENCYILSGNRCLPKYISYNFKKDFSMEYFKFIQSYKRRTNVMTRCRIPEACERYKIDIGIYAPKSKLILPRNGKQWENVYTFTKIIIVLFGKKIDEIVYLTV